MLLLSAFAFFGFTPVQAEVPGKVTSIGLSVNFGDRGNPQDAGFTLSWEANDEGGVADGWKVYAMQYDGTEPNRTEIGDVPETEFSMGFDELRDFMENARPAPIFFQVAGYNDDGLGEYSNPIELGGPDRDGPGNDDYDEILERIREIVKEIAGEDFEGDPCDLTAEQREEINEKLNEEFGEDCPIRILCPGDEDFPDFPDFPDWPERDFDPERIAEIIKSVAGEDFNGDPCDLTEEQREEINEKLAEEFGEDFPIRIWCPGDGDYPDYPDWPDYDDSTNHDSIFVRIEEIIKSVAGEDFNGDPCDLTEEQRKEINEKLAEEFGDECPIQFLCPGDEGYPDYPDWPDYDDSTDYDELFETLEEIIRDVAGDDFSGDPCDLTEEQREEINRRILEEFGEECPFEIICPGDHDNWPGDDYDNEFIERLNDMFDQIIRDVLGEDFEGEPTQEQLEEILKRLQDLLGEEFDWGDMPWGDVNNEVISDNPKNSQNSDDVLSNVRDDNSVISQVTAFPNPAVNSVRLEFDAAVGGNAVLTLTTLSGNKVHAQTLQTVEGNNTVTLDVRALNSGTYYVNIQSNGTNLHTAPVVIQR